MSWIFRLKDRVTATLANFPIVPAAAKQGHAPSPRNLPGLRFSRSNIRPQRCRPSCRLPRKPATRSQV